MKRILVWDLPTRLLHWTLAGTILAAFVVANVTDDESGAFPVHMLLGLVAVFVVAVRIVWGFAGSRWARFGSFPLRPGEFFAYVAEAVRGKGERYAGHNPGSAWFALGVFGCVVGLAVTGLAKANGVEGVEEVHEVLAWGLIALVAAHLAGIALHTFRHHEVVALSMVDGRKEAEPGAAIASMQAVPAVLALAMTGAWAGTLWQGYDPGARQLTVLGATLSLGEDEEHEGGERGESGERGEGGREGGERLEGGFWRGGDGDGDDD